MKYLYCLIILLSSCINKKNNIDYIDVYFISSGVSTFSSVECDNFESLSSSYKFGVRIKKDNFLEEFENEFKNYQDTVNSNSKEIRIKSLIYYKDGTVDTLCMGEHFQTYINGKSVRDSPIMLSLIKKQINYSNSFRTPDEYSDTFNKALQETLNSDKLDESFKGYNTDMADNFVLSVSNVDILTKQLNIKKFNRSIDFVDRDSIRSNKNLIYLKVKKFSMSMDSAYLKCFYSLNKKDIETYFKKDGEDWKVNTMP